jgi:hypothetical protein
MKRSARRGRRWTRDITKQPLLEVRSNHREEKRENKDGTRWDVRNRIKLGRNLPHEWKKGMVAFCNALAFEYPFDNFLGGKFTLDVQILDYRVPF